MSFDSTLSAPSDAEFGTATNGAANALASAKPGLRVLVVGVLVSASGAAATSVLVTVTDSNDGLLDEFYIPAGAFTPVGVNYNNHPLRGSVGGSVTLSLPALGAAIIGISSIRYVYDRP
jgi:hypothetical protein